MCHLGWTEQEVLEVFDRFPGLHGADILHIQPEMPASSARKQMLLSAAITPNALRLTAASHWVGRMQPPWLDPNQA